MDLKIAKRLIANRSNGENLIRRNTHYANINARKAAWWINIPIDKVQYDLNLILIAETEIFRLLIPANTFNELGKFFRIWDDKNAIDLLISSDKKNQYFLDINAKSSGVNFKPFIVDQFEIPEDFSKEKASFHKTSFTNKVEETQHKKYPIPKQRIIKKDQPEISYKTLFGEYLSGASSITLQDPFIRFPHQIDNLVDFCKMLGEIKEPHNELFLNLVTWNEVDMQPLSKSNFEQVANSFINLNITITFKFENHHDRYIQTDNGWKIILGRGLDIYKKPDDRYALRKCKPCEITYLRLNKSGAELEKTL